MKDMEPSQVVGSGKEYTLAYYDGSQRKVFVTDIETDFPEGKLIVSCTDPAGMITQCNQAFVDMSGYTREESAAQHSASSGSAQGGFCRFVDDGSVGKQMARIRQESAQGRWVLLGICRHCSQYPRRQDCRLYLGAP